MHHRLGKPQGVFGTSGGTNGHKIKQLQTLHNRRRTVSVSAGKRSSRDKLGKGNQGPLYITIEADGSDLWRLDPVISMLQEGAVGLSSAFSVISPQSLLPLVIPPSAQQHNSIQHCAMQQEHSTSALMAVVPCKKQSTRLKCEVLHALDADGNHPNRQLSRWVFAQHYTFTGMAM